MSWFESEYIKNLNPLPTGEVSIGDLMPIYDDVREQEYSISLNRLASLISGGFDVELAGVQIGTGVTTLNVVVGASGATWSVVADEVTLDLSSITGGGGGGAVSSVFGRTGAVVAATNDYTFAQIGTKPTTLAGYGITDAAALSHVHAATDITSGTMATARLGSGTANSTTFLRGDNTWATPAGGGTIGGTVSSGFIPIANGANTVADSALTFAGSILAGLSGVNIGTPDGPTASIRLPTGGGISVSTQGSYKGWLVRQGGSNEVIHGTTFVGDVFTNKHIFYSGTDNSRYVEIAASEVLGVGGVGALGSVGVPWHNVYANTLTSYNIIITKATAAGGSGFRLPHGTAPSGPIDGDVWTTSAGMYARINGSTVGPFGTAGAGVGDGTYGDIVVSGGGTTWSIGTGVIVNADINASAAIADTKLATISTAGKVSNSATTAASANTASAIVARDGSGNFTAGTITATEFVGGGVGLTALNATNIASGTLAAARLPATAALTTGTLAQFAPTTSAQLLGVISDETGTGLLVFGTNPTLTGYTLAGTAAHADNLTTRAYLQDYAELVNAIGNSSGTLTVNYESGNVATATLTGNITTFSITNPPASGRCGSITLYLTQDGTGNRTVAWGSSVNWATSAPTLGAAGRVDIVVLTTVNGGTDWFAVHVGTFPT